MDSKDEVKAMVLCAGFGTRLGDLTRTVPKPMLLVQNRPILEYILVNLRRHGFDKIAINLHFMPETIRDFFRDGSQFNLDLTYSHEPRLLGTAGGIKHIEAFFQGEEEFLVHYGDIVTDQDFTAMLKFHQQHSALVTLLVHERARSNSVVAMDAENRVVAFLERPDDEAKRTLVSKWVNSGVCVCSPEILDTIPPDVSCDLPRDIFPKLIPSGRVFGFPLSHYRCAVDSPERLAEVQAAIANGKCQLSAG